MYIDPNQFQTLTYPAVDYGLRHSVAAPALVNQMVVVEGLFCTYLTVSGYYPDAASVSRWRSVGRLPNHLREYYSSEFGAEAMLRDIRKYIIPYIIAPDSLACWLERLIDLDTHIDPSIKVRLLRHRPREDAGDLAVMLRDALWYIMVRR